MPKVTCPKCSTTLRVPNDLPAGKRVRCPECETKFAPVAADDEPVRPSRRRESSRDDERDDVPRRTKSKGRKQKKKDNTPLIVGAVLGGLLLLVGGALAVYALTGDSEDGVAIAPPQPGNAGPVGGPEVNIPGGDGNAAPKGGVGLEVGNLAPEIEGEDIDGEMFKLTDYRGKVVLLDFWGHW